ncbi:tyrosinase family protein [Williamsia sp. 1135]|uniref:tyrosinase family protein n=1 Tax=Williamsia sp. 1135 TaxID=1889262 RepID=UPI0011802C32|nr:tyrosinase family protein [Williamsia sp. 1135]
MLTSSLFSGDPLLEAIAADGPQRISTAQNRNDPAVVKVQTALLDWDPGALPLFGADGDYGSESAGAVHRFKRDELLVPEPEIVDDVGPRTVRRLDEIRVAVENPVPPPPPPPPPPPTTLVRRDAWHLSAVDQRHPILTAYARAVGVLKRNAGTDRRMWWSHHTQVHGMTPDPQDGLRNQCQHFSWYFLPWHRMYLDQFESVCREIIVADPLTPDDIKQTWALPYWDYDRPDSNALPPIFRMPDLDGAPNPLFDAERAPGMNSLSTPARLTPAETRASGWFRARDFSATAPFPSFGGPVTGFHHLNESGSQIMGALESTPHGTVHGAVGGVNGKMMDFDRAAGDPIFWLHHSNIDRLWEVWRANTGAGRDSVDTAFLNRTYGFADSVGGAQTVAVRDVVPPSPRPHTYEDLSVPSSAGVAPVRGLAVTEDNPPQTIGAIDNPLELVNGIANAVELSMPDFAALQFDSPGRVFIAIDHLVATDIPATTFGVYVDDGGDGAWVGNLPLFGLAESMRSDAEHGLSFTFEITDIVESLVAAGNFDPSRLGLRFEPIGEAGDTVGVGSVQVGSVSILLG